MDVEWNSLARQARSSITETRAYDPVFYESLAPLLKQGGLATPQDTLDYRYLTSLYNGYLFFERGDTLASMAFMVDTLPLYESLPTERYLAQLVKVVDHLIDTMHAYEDPVPHATWATGMIREVEPLLIRHADDYLIDALSNRSRTLHKAIAGLPPAQQEAILSALEEGRRGPLSFTAVAYVVTPQALFLLLLWLFRGHATSAMLRHRLVRLEGRNAVSVQVDEETYVVGALVKRYDD